MILAYEKLAPSVKTFCEPGLPLAGIHIFYFSQEHNEQVNSNLTTLTNFFNMLKKLLSFSIMELDFESKISYNQSKHLIVYLFDLNLFFCLFQVAASLKKDMDGQIPNYPNLPSKLLCLLHNVTLHV
ncbi:Auxin response factor [Arachis hypogaea]|nr:Auxin response factor [Arachis hypogaea]